MSEADQRNVKEIGKAFEPNSFEDFMVHHMSGGMMGVDEEGKFETGVGIRHADEAIGEIGGRNARRQELNNRTKAFIEEKKVREELEAEEALAEEKADRSASLAGPGGGGQAASRRADSRSDSGGGFRLGEQRDFLGL